MLYLLKSYLLSAILIGLYFLFLRNSGQWKFNRFYLLTSLLLLLLWPSVNFQFETETMPMLLQEGTQLVSSGLKKASFINQPTKTSYPQENSLSSYLLGIYFIVSAFFLLRFFTKLFSLLNKKLVKKAEGELIYEAEGEIPYSFFNRLYLPKSQAIADQIIQHEKVHVRQWHSLDVCFLELILCFYWFNPLLWVFRKVIKENHEFLADQGVLKNQPNPEYLQLILQSLKKQNQHYLSNPFSYLSIKNRINMIQNPPKSKFKKSVKLTLSLLILTTVLAAFSLKTDKIEAELNQKVKSGTGMSIFKVPRGLPIEKSKIHKVAAGYGNRTHPLTKKEKLHRGIDLLAPEGTPILATADGVVKCSKTNTTGYGKHVIIQHNGTYSSLYAHLSALKVIAGELVNQGDTLGIIGTSGTSLSVHLHYEIREDEKAIDPMRFLKLEAKGQH